jgi:hypothetical protein
MWGIPADMLRLALILSTATLFGAALVIAVDYEVASASGPVWGGQSHSVPFQLDIGDDSMCARRADGTVKCWGNGIGDSALEMGDNNPSVSFPNNSRVKSVVSRAE